MLKLAGLAMLCLGPMSCGLHLPSSSTDHPSSCNETITAEINGVKQLQYSITPPAVDIAALEAAKHRLNAADTECKISPAWQFTSWVVEYTEAKAYCAMGYRDKGYNALLGSRDRLKYFAGLVQKPRSKEEVEHIQAEMERMIYLCNPNSNPYGPTEMPEPGSAS